MASAALPRANNTAFNAKVIKTIPSPVIPISTLSHQSNPNSNSNSNSNQRRSITNISSNINININSNKINSVSKKSTPKSSTSLGSSPTNFSLSHPPSMSTAPTGTSGPNKLHAHSLSASSTISYPHPSLHPPLRLLTTATCPDTVTCLVSAQSPPHSPTFTTITLPPKSSSSANSGASSGSRANSILDGIQTALGVTSSSPPSSSASTYSAAKESLADFSIPPSKRFGGRQSKVGKKGKEASTNGVLRSRSNYFSFPNFDEVDFVDVAMVEDNEEDDDDDHSGWSSPDSPPEGQRPTIMDEKMMRTATTSQLLHHQGLRKGLSMPSSPSQHWLLQLETYH
ncbi:hypothetical protein BCR41DRAFT_362522, partial [Lobosporangium transversale]